MTPEYKPDLYTRIFRRMMGYTPSACAVLLYHRVCNYSTDPQQLCVTPENFSKQLNHIKTNYHPLGIEEFTYCLKNRMPFPSKSVCITFDDGYEDNFRVALPLLEEFNMQALFYISTGTLNTENEFWWDTMERIFLLSDGMPVAESIKLRDIEYPVYNLSPDEKLYLYEKLLPVLRRMPAQERDDYIKELEAVFEIPKPRNTHRAMNSDELKKLSLSPSAVIGAHTQNHPSLGALGKDMQLEEITTSKTLLEEKTGQKIHHFSYPFGTLEDFNNDTIDICQHLGFDTAAANYPAMVTKNSNPYAFPRFLVRDWNDEIFDRQLKNFIRS